MKKVISILISLIVLTLALSACSGEIDKNKELSIVCTTFPQYDYIKNIIGGSDGLTLLFDDGADLHSYVPTARDIIKLANADLFVYIGGSSDSWVSGALKSADNGDLKTVALMDIIEPLEEEYVAGMERETQEHHEAHSGEHGEEDEHIWLSLKNSAAITKSLCETICSIYPDNAEAYKANAEAYIEKLNALDAEYQQTVDSAKRQTLLFADRFPFRYLTEDYNLTYYAAFAGCSSESEASFQTMAHLINVTKELELPVVLTIEKSDGSIAKTICDATGAKTAALNSCQSVTRRDIDEGASYIVIMENNLKVLREALN